MNMYSHNFSYLCAVVYACNNGMMIFMIISRGRHFSFVRGHMMVRRTINYDGFKLVAE